MVGCRRAPARLMVLVFALANVCVASPPKAWTLRLPPPDLSDTRALSLRFELPPELTARQSPATPPEGEGRDNVQSTRVVSKPMARGLPTRSYYPDGAQSVSRTPDGGALSPADDQPKPAGGDEDPLQWSSPKLQAGNLRASFGPQKLSYSSLIHRDHERRGAVAEWRLNGQTQIRGFGMQSQRDGDSRQVIAEDATSYRLNGLVVQKALEVGNAGQLGLAAAWISGHTQVEDAGSHEGDAWSIAGEASALSERLHLHAEYAGSRSERYDNTAGDPITAADSADALRLGAEVRAPVDSPAAWHIGASLREVAGGFASPGNPGLAPNRRELRAYAGAEFGAWEFDLSFDRRRDNPAQDPSQPTVVNDAWTLSTLRPSTASVAAGSSKATSYRFSARYSRRRPASGDADIGGQAVASDDLMLEGELDAADWQLGLRVRGGVEDGPVGADSGDAPILGFELYGDLPDSLPIPIKPALSWGRHHATHDGAASDVWRATAKVPSVVLRHDLAADFDLALQHRGATDGQPSAFSAGIGLDLVWTLQRPARNRQGLTLSISGKVSSSATDGDGTEDAGYGLMISLTSENPLGGW